MDHMVQLSPTPSGSGPTSNRGSGPASGLGPRGPVAALERRRLEAAPLITWYRGRDRVELSGRTVGSWVAKTVHLLTEEGIAPGNRVGLPLLARHPLHWVSLTWLLSCWWAGVVPVVGRGPSDAPTDLDVSGPDPSGSDPRVPLVQCSLAPLGGACRNPAPGAIDFSDALAMPDEMPAPACARPTTARMEGTASLSEADLAAVLPIDRRMLVATAPPPMDLALLLTGCLTGSGSLILVDEMLDGSTPAALADQEGAEIAS